ncbi:MAG: hypothetical protein DMG08_01115, partial [Acidobacteria bacterium]
EVRGLLMTLFRIATYTNDPELMSAGTAIEQSKGHLPKIPCISTVDGKRSLTDSRRRRHLAVSSWRQV